MSSTADLPQPSSAAVERPEGMFRFVVTGNDAQRRSYIVRNEFRRVESPVDQSESALFEAAATDPASYLGLGGPNDTTEILPPYPLLPNGAGVHERGIAGTAHLGYFRLPDDADWFFKQGDP